MAYCAEMRNAVWVVAGVTLFSVLGFLIVRAMLTDPQGNCLEDQGDGTFDTAPECRPSDYP